MGIPHKATEAKAWERVVAEVDATLPEQQESEFLGEVVVGWASGQAQEIVHPIPQRPRYFGAMAMAGRLYVQGVPDRGPWNSKALIYWTEEQVNRILNERVGDRKVRSPGELREAVRQSAVRPTSVKVWIAEGLQDAAMVEWTCTVGSAVSPRESGRVPLRGSLLR